MNTVLSSYGQLCGCPEILKKSCKFFCRGLDIRVTQCVKICIRNPACFYDGLKAVFHCPWFHIDITGSGKHIGIRRHFHFF